MTKTSNDPVTSGPVVDDSESVSLSAQVGRFVDGTDAADIPHEVLERARHLILDAVGIAFASTGYEYAGVGRDALTRFDTGDHPVLGMSDRLSARDAAVLNGVLIHGMDYDDTHMASLAHPTSAILPAVLSAATAADASTRELLAAYVLGVEVDVRVGMGAPEGRFHDAGFHPTPIAGAFGAAAAAGKLMGLDADGIAAAQGIVGSMAAGLMQYVDSGAWTKRLHPGWAAVAGLHAASFAASGWVSPPQVYEGRFGIYATHIGDTSGAHIVARELGRTWEVLNVAIKPYPMCHYIHAFADAVLALRAGETVDPAEVTAIRCLINPVEAKIVCEPADRKWHPQNEYDAKFSLPYVVATTLVRGRFGLPELDDEARSDAVALDLAQKVVIADDPDTAYPEAFSGAVEIELADGRTLTRREQINRGHPDRPLGQQEIADKFRDNMATVADRKTAERVEQAVLSLGDHTPATDFVEACRAW